MPSFIIPNVSKTFQLDNYLIPAFSKIMLWKNNIVPDRTTTLSSLVECDFPGYARQTVASWSAAAIGVDNYAFTNGADVTFTRSSGTPNNDVYGAALLDSSGHLLGVSLLDGGPFSMNVVGDILVVSTKYKHGSIDSN